MSGGACGLDGALALRLERGLLEIAVLVVEWLGDAWLMPRVFILQSGPDGGYTGCMGRRRDSPRLLKCGWRGG